jgi:serine/threonine protein phosphatase 1
MRWIVGDIHGMLKPLEAVLAAVAAADAKARLYFVGDYVNRGPDSRGVVDLLLQLTNARFIRGNHDDVFDHLLSQQGITCEKGESSLLAVFEMFMHFGLDKTLLSYGHDLAALRKLEAKPTRDGIQRLAEKVPETHRRFFRQLPLVIEEKDIFVAHAMWDPSEPSEAPTLHERLRDDPLRMHRLLWGRYENREISQPKAWKRMGFFGHTPTSRYREDRSPPRPMAGPKIVLLDTGAFDRHGRLTAFCADTGTFVQSDHFGKLVDQA